MAKAATYRDAAKEKRERLERGEAVPGDFSKLPAFEQILRDAGWSTSDIERRIGMAGLSEAQFEAMLHEVHAATERARQGHR